MIPEEKLIFDELMREQNRSDLEALMKLPEGRRFLLMFIGNICRTRRACFEATARDTDFALGKQSVGYILESMMDELTPELLLHGQNEYRVMRDNFILKAKSLFKERKENELV